MNGDAANGTASERHDADGPPSVLSNQQIAAHDATLVEWAKAKAIAVDAATHGASALERFISRSVAEYHGIRDAAWTDARDQVLGTRVRDYHKSGGFHPTGRVGTLYDLLRPSQGPSRCRELCKAAKNESASDLRAVTIDAKIQSLWEAIENVFVAAFAKAQNELSDELADERFCKAWDDLRDYVPQRKKEEHASCDLLGDPKPNDRLVPFTGGQMIFFPDHVELCGFDICGGSRSKRRRKILDLLRVKRANGQFAAYSGAELAEELGLSGLIIAGTIRDLRKRITSTLRQYANLQCGDEDAILSSGPGYRLADSISVQQAGEPSVVQIGDMTVTHPVPNVPDSKSNNVPDVPDAPHRRRWILDQLHGENRLRAPAIARQLNCHVKTVKRDLADLKKEGKIEFVGKPRTGYYRLCKPASGSSAIRPRAS